MLVWLWLSVVPLLRRDALPCATGVYYKARIDAIHEDGTVNVTFTEYGNTDVVQYSSLRALGGGVMAAAAAARTAKRAADEGAEAPSAAARQLTKAEKAVRLLAAPPRPRGRRASYRLPGRKSGRQSCAAPPRKRSASKKWTRWPSPLRARGRPSTANACVVPRISQRRPLTPTTRQDKLAKKSSWTDKPRKSIFASPASVDGKVGPPDLSFCGCAT